MTKCIYSLITSILICTITLAQNITITPPQTEKVKALSIKKRTTKDNPEYVYCLDVEKGIFEIQISLVYANHPEYIPIYSPFDDFFLQTRIDMNYSDSTVLVQRNYSPVVTLSPFNEFHFSECSSCEENLKERVYFIRFDISDFTTNSELSCQQIADNLSITIYSNVTLVNKQNPSLLLNTIISHSCSDIFPHSCFYQSSTMDKTTISVQCTKCE